MATPEPLLVLASVESGYGQSQVLRGLNLSVGAGEVVGLLGRNGMGKTTTLRTVMGLNRAWSGTIRFDGSRIERLATGEIARRGVALVPDTRRIFGSLSVKENLLVAAQKPAAAAGVAWAYDTVVAVFPRLAERQSNMGNELSGGEQQMLAIGRGLMANPALLLIDEAFEGLAPLIRSAIGDVLKRIAGLGQSILLVDSEADRVAALADRIVILELGRVVWEGDAETFRSAAADLKLTYLGV